ncbi:MAG: TetR/AcrR family transcriptional regulator [Stackebrandtia sp.]
MSVTADKRTPRPGGRTAKVRRAVLDAAIEELIEHGFHGLNMEQVAARAGVGKTTVYRRWRTPAGLTVDLLDDLTERSTTLPDTGTIAGNLAAQAESVLSALLDPRLGPVLKALVAAATCDERTAAALRNFHLARIATWSAHVTAAVERGELPAGTDPDEITRAIPAQLYYRTMVTGDPIDEPLTEQLVRTTLAAARAGAFVPG